MNYVIRSEAADLSDVLPRVHHRFLADLLNHEVQLLQHSRKDLSLYIADFADYSGKEEESDDGDMYRVVEIIVCRLWQEDCDHRYKTVSIPYGSVHSSQFNDIGIFSKLKFAILSWNV